MLAAAGTASVRSVMGLILEGQTDGGQEDYHVKPLSSAATR